MFETEKMQLSHGITEVNRWIVNLLENVEKSVIIPLRERISQLEKETADLKTRLEKYEPIDKSVNTPDVP